MNQTSDTNSTATVSPGQLPPRAVLHRVAMPLFLFAAVLTSLLLLSWFLLLPQLTEVEVGGSVRGVRELKDYKATLTAQIGEIEAERDSFLLPDSDPLYQELLKEKESIEKLMNIRGAIAHTAKNLVPGEVTVVFAAMHFNVLGNTVSLRGDVRNVGTRSMTVLAQFVEALRELPSVEHVEASKFMRTEDPERGFTSPFTLTITLQ